MASVRLSGCAHREAGSDGALDEIVTGFGWTNGVAIWLGAEYGARLNTPTCPSIVNADGMTPARSLARRRLAERSPEHDVLRARGFKAY